MRRPSLLTAAFFFSVAPLGACGGTDVASPDTVGGRYELKTVDAKPVPALNYVEGAYTFEVVSGFYDLHDDGTFNSSMTYREKYVGWTHVSTHSFEGTFTPRADTLVFAWTGGDSTWTGLKNGRQLTVVDHGRVSVFSK